MEHHILVSFGPGREYGFELRDADTAALSWEQAHKWIDEEYVRAKHAAASPVGMASLADKILCIATAHGPQPFAEASAWARQFARCTGRTTGRIRITVRIDDQRLAL